MKHRLELPATTAFFVAVAIVACSTTEVPIPLADQVDAPPTLRIFIARAIHTMAASPRRATAVAVEAGRIVSVGSLESVEAALEGRDYLLDEQFSELVLLPGLIDPHVHPLMAAIVLPMEIIASDDWTLADRDIAGVRGREAYLARLREVETAQAGPAAWLWTWGYSDLFHGEIERADLDAISEQRPIVVWHRSFQAVTANTAALDAMVMTAEKVRGRSDVDLERGQFQDGGVELILAVVAPRLLEPARYQRGLALAADLIHRGGITAVTDGGFGSIDLEAEWQSLQAAWDRDDTPFRALLLPDGRALWRRLGEERALDAILALPERSTNRLRFPDRAVQLFADGGVYSQQMQMTGGYLDEHEGLWEMEPADFEDAARLFWMQDFQINVRVNGDLGIRMVLDVLGRLQQERPRNDHRFALHDLSVAGEEQIGRIAELGAIVSANPYYLWALSDPYSRIGLGPERAARLVAAGSLVRHGVRLSFHSDFATAPANPLRLASIATTRNDAEGEVKAPEERITLDAAMRAITIDAAHLLQLEDEIGSIEAGKMADFTVLFEDPWEIGAAALAAGRIWGTVFEGTPYPID